MKKKAALGVALILALILPVLAAAPESLSVIINGYTLKGKALWYKGRIYVPLEDVATSTGGTYNYNQAQSTAVVSVGGPQLRRPAPQVNNNARPHLKVVWEKKYVTQDNAKVMATISNRGNVPANDVEAICIFKDGTLQEVGASAQGLGTLDPGQSRTVEFRLYEAPITGQGGGGYWGPPVAFTNIGNGRELLIDGQWTRVSYELKLNYN